MYYVCSNFLIKLDLFLLLLEADFGQDGGVDQHDDAVDDGDGAHGEAGVTPRVGRDCADCNVVMNLNGQGAGGKEKDGAENHEDKLLKNDDEDIKEDNFDAGLLFSHRLCRHCVPGQVG
jgi:hypothetical protein